ncbi:CadC family transcriptional regulator [Salmonella enterica subsp. enterica serovar Chester]|nr:CadC family transcriptional regulator [Salmonella enterica subsp. enterica serovar Chester]MLT46691.1 transcriptional regulator CadC [Salmonella enterica subsp. enterica serovar Chester]
MQSFMLQVGDWLVTPSVNRISYQERNILLEPRLIDLLVYFAHHPDEVLSREEIIDNVWNRSIVTDHVVTQSISKLRRSLKNGSDQEYIITIPKRGYKLIATVIWNEDQPIISDSSRTADNEDDKVTNIQPALMEKKEGAFCVKGRRNIKRRNMNTKFWFWCLSFLSLSSIVALIIMSILSFQPMRISKNTLLNPRDIDVLFEPGNNSNNCSPQRIYAISLGEIITSSLNTFSTFMVHNKTDYYANESSPAGKTLLMKFINKRHFRAQQCFMLVQLIDNTDNSLMLDKRYFITSNNLISVTEDLLNTLSVVLRQPWPDEFKKRQKRFISLKNSAVMQYFMAHQLLAEGSIENLDNASKIMNEVIKASPDFITAAAEKMMIDSLRRSHSSFNQKQQEISTDAAKESKETSAIINEPAYYQMMAIEQMANGNTDKAIKSINKCIDMETSWLNYILLGKAYEMKGENHIAADCYISAFNLTPSKNTLYWIKNGIFQSPVEKIVPYLDIFRQKVE